MTDTPQNDKDTPAMAPSPTPTPEARPAAGSEPNDPATAGAGARHTAQAASAGKRRGGAPLLLNLILLAGLGALGFLVWQQQQAVARFAGSSIELQQRNAALSQRVDAADADRARLAAELASALAAAADNPAEDAVALLGADLEALRRELLTRTASSARDWSRLEAAALLRLARQQALSAATLPSAIRLYQDAANLLRQSNDAALQPVRAALQLELDALRSVEVPPVDDLYLQLGQLAAQLDTLQVQSQDEAPLQFSAPQPTALATAASWWEQIKQVLSQYFVVRRQDAPLLARLTPEQAFLVRQSIRLQLEGARLALLQGDTALYQAALDAARDGITAQLQGEAKAALLASLQRLRNTPIEIRLPTLGAALQSLEQLDTGNGAAPGAATP